MQRQILGFLALISAIATSALVFTSDLQPSFMVSILTLVLIALHLRFQNAKPKRAEEKKTGMKLIDELNERLNISKQQMQNLMSQIQTLEQTAKANDSADAAVLIFLRVLQEKSRLLDFALTDIARLPDPQVGAAARVVHQGLRGFLQDSFEIAPIAGESEGQRLALPDDFDSTRYRILKQSSAQQKPAGIVLHRGWEVKKMNLPRSLRRPEDPLPSILAPVEIEVREV